ncbi:MAG: acetyl-CoA carboxylase biotin carboxyl carrier protein subunit [Candidatus Buchananbacteria bacterium]|nr:acetyl-CoA carboxylase biotin carboxyl carrier protein subunit [Candidatus Buchananbacteria bacterium]
MEITDGKTQLTITAKPHNHQPETKTLASETIWPTVRVLSPTVGFTELLVRVGDYVETGSPLGGIAISNQSSATVTIQAPCNGTVVEVLAENGEGVEFKQPLLEIKPHLNDTGVHPAK